MGVPGIVFVMTSENVRPMCSIMWLSGIKAKKILVFYQETEYHSIIEHFPNRREGETIRQISQTYG
jgi:hypothetical protein